MHQPEARPRSAARSAARSATRSAARLAPGLRVVSRGVDQLQVGLYDGRRAVLARSDVVERALAQLLEHLPVDEDPQVLAVLDRLHRHGLLDWDRPPRGTPARVAVLGQLALPGLPDLPSLFETAGITLTSSTPDADVVMVLSSGELDRERVDPLVRDRTSHLVVRLVDGGAVLGPFVVPGVTACLRCIDAHQSARDPDHVAVTARYVRAGARVRPDGVPDIDPALAALALAWAARDVIAHLDGREPSTWSRTLVLAAEPARRDEQEWRRHPQCGCCW